VEYLGADSLIAARAQSQSLLVRVPGKARVSAGERIHIQWSKEQEHRFDTQGGRT